MVFHIGQLRPYRWYEVKHFTGYEDMIDVTHGDIVQVLGHLIEWDDDCVPVQLCESWRHVGDPTCDAALREVFSHPSATVGKDLLQALQDRVAAAPGDFPNVEAFLDEILRPPPTELLVSDEEVIVAQDFFIDFSIQLLQALMHYSLAGGLSSSRIVRTLEAVSYLVPHVNKANGALHPSLSDIVAQITKASSDRTFVRLVETLQFILDVMGCSAGAEMMSGGDISHNKTAYLLPGREGWRSTVRVRLLHAVARWRVQTRWNSETSQYAPVGVPVNQEEVAATLAAFSTVPMWCLHRLVVPPTAQQASAYLALWRHVGYYMGVSPQILQRYFTSTRAADKFAATAALSLFYDDLPNIPSPIVPSSSISSSPAFSPSLLRGPTIPILVAVSNRPPLHTSLEYNIALTTHLLGDPLARHVGLPRSALTIRLKMHAFLLLQRVPTYFARWYPRRAWVEKRRAVLREGMVRSVRWNMGMRRSAFRPRTMVALESEKSSRDEGGARAEVGASGGGELATGVAEAEQVQPDLVRSRILTKQWREVFVEMVGVCVVGGVVVCVAIYLGTIYALAAATSVLKVYY